MLEKRQRESLAQKAYKQIKDALCEGKISPGDIISESQMAEELGMSRTPVREAFRILASEDLLEIKNGIGAYVKPLSTRDMEELYEVRCLLESEAGKTAVFYITNEEIDRMESRFTELLEECDRGQIPDARTFSTLDWEFHELIVDRCQNRYIRTIIQNNTQNIKRYQFLSAKSLNDIRESTRQHLDILAVMRRRDPEAMAEKLKQHFQWAAGVLN